MMLQQKYPSGARCSCEKGGHLSATNASTAIWCWSSSTLKVLV